MTRSFEWLMCRALAIRLRCANGDWLEDHRVIFPLTSCCATHTWVSRGTCWTWGTLYLCSYTRSASAQPPAMSPLRTFIQFEMFVPACGKMNGTYS